MIKDSSVFLDHIIENIVDIESFIKGINKKDFLKNKEKQNAVIRSLEIIGEAVKNLPQNITNKYPNIPWKEIAGTRDRITHHYFKVDLDIIWDIIKQDIPKLKQEILKVRKDLK
ncbi:MAG: DUF86 domain-containing protein [Candidatus Pacearchaeota archaeon]